ncbi:hypothetical protein HNV11_22125 [Spirosoma taeanense]|uniref:Carboxypeptidase regulatory-like domain-containing protein n=1 Tax=Spirosoma taeanense TaxID=2735870 RepID=A0A6M5YCV9_9BACT|nr:hypothetical protein [Spirosoma taeanense]QJW91885.1 hypothetical protein HNV11_22125 [Spirosoma taeanense]
MRNAHILLAVLLLALGTACAQKSQRRKANQPSVKQGICGTVIVKRGNQMPGPGAPRPGSGGSPAEREVLIFPLLNASQVDMGDNGFIKSVHEAKPVKTVRSGKDGKFCVDLPAGQYSVVVREPKGLYANLTDGQNNIFPVSVTNGKAETVIVEITHQAVF